MTLPQTLPHSLARAFRAMGVAAGESPEALRSGLPNAPLLLVAPCFGAALVQAVAGGQIEKGGKRYLPPARFTLQPGLQIG